MHLDSNEDWAGCRNVVKHFWLLQDQAYFWYTEFCD